MYSLLLKDILLSKKTLVIVMLYSFVLLFLFKSMQNAAFVAGTVAVAYMMIMRACAYDDMNKSEIMLNSLPVSRKQIVLAKYLAVLLYAVLAIFLSLVSGIIAKALGFLDLAPVTLEGITAAFVSLGLMSSLYFPVFFRFGYIKSKYFNMFLFFFFFFVPVFLAQSVKVGSRPWLQKAYSTLQQQQDWVVAIGLISLILLLSAGSAALSLAFYKRREF